MTDTPEHSTAAPPVIAERHVELLRNVWNLARTEAYSDEIEIADPQISEISILLRSIADGSVVCVKRSEMERVLSRIENRGYQYHERMAYAKATLRGWLSDTTGRTT